MSAERLTVERRAARHAALADPARLRIVDELTLGDLSPTELQTMLGMASNLLAHHLKVLEAEGIVERRRSEGDARRTYVRLEPTSLDGLDFAIRRAVPRVVFICTANSARSQLAAALWRLVSDVPADSAGTHPAPRVAPGAVAAAARFGIPLAVARPRSLDEVLRGDDFVVTVCDNAHEELVARDRPAPGAHWAVADPVRVATDAAFDAAVAELTQRVGDLAPRLTPA